MTYVEVSYPIGMMIGGILLAVWKPKIHALVLASVAPMIIGLACIASGMLPSAWLWVFVGLLVMMGVVNTIEYAAMNAFQQLKVPQDKLGRVMSINFAVSSLPSILGLVLV